MENENTFVLGGELPENWDDAPPATKEQIEKAGKEGLSLLTNYFADAFDKKITSMM
jgi:hypothetical protein